MQQTLAKVKNLEKFIEKHGDDSVISQTITKMLDYKIQKYDEEINRFDKTLKKYERNTKKILLFSLTNLTEAGLAMIWIG